MWNGAGGSNYTPLDTIDDRTVITAAEAADEFPDADPLGPPQHEPD